MVPGSAPCGLNLIGDAEPAVLANDSLDYLEVLGWWIDDAADALDGLGYEARDAP